MKSRLLAKCNDDVSQSISDCLSSDLGILITVLDSKLAASYPSIFQLDTTTTPEYSGQLDVWMGRRIVGSSFSGLVCLDNCLHDIICTLTDCVILRNEYIDPMQTLSPDVSFCRNSALVLKMYSRATDHDAETLLSGLAGSFPLLARKVFPSSHPAIPIIISSPEAIRIVEISYDTDSSLYFQRTLRNYYVGKSLGLRVEFISEFFRLLKWVAATSGPCDPSFPLIPGVRQRTRNGHYLTWSVDGLHKEFKHCDRNIPLDLIARIYEANLTHVEHGRIEGHGVIITSVGSPMALSLHRFPDRSEVVRQVRAALDEIHSLKIAHCDVCIDNLFVLEDDTIILGDLEFCTPFGSKPPRVRIRFDGESPASARKLDEKQFAKLTQELDELYCVLAH